MKVLAIYVPYQDTRQEVLSMFFNKRYTNSTFDEKFDVISIF